MNRTGIEIKHDRGLLGLTQQEMAKKIDLQFPNYTKKERGITKWSDEEKLKIAKVFGYNLERFDDVFYDGQLRRL